MIAYKEHGNYLIPDLDLPEQENRFIGKYGLRRKAYLKTHRKLIYTNLLTAGTLHKHLADTDEQAKDMLEGLVRQIASARGVTEDLKAADQMAWVGAMNNIRVCAEEIVMAEIVYA